jgi:hypothetical protein
VICNQRTTSLRIPSNNLHDSQTVREGGFRSLCSSFPLWSILVQMKVMHSRPLKKLLAATHLLHVLDVTATAVY